jgi:hypothetical protein
MSLCAPFWGSDGYAAPVEAAFRPLICKLVGKGQGRGGGQGTYSDHLVGGPACSATASSWAH